MKIAFSYLLILTILLSYGTYKHNQQQRHTKNVLQKVARSERSKTLYNREKTRQTDIARVKAFFTRYKSPLQNYADVFVDDAYIYGIDYRVIPSISMVESTGCKYPAPGTDYNCWGFKSYSAPNGWWRFSGYRDGIHKVAQTLGTENYYASFRQTKSIQELSENYNNGSQDWAQKVTWFINQL